MSNETEKCNDQPASERSCPDPDGSIRRNITLDPEVDRKAHLLAKYTDRKFSNLIEMCLRRKIAEMELNGWIP